MNSSGSKPYVLRAAFAGLLAVTAVTTVFALRAADPPKTGSQATPNVSGTWILVGKPGEAVEIPTAGARIKFIADRHWSITQADPKTGLTVFHHGGTYALEGNEYSETVEYANQSTSELIKQTFKFNLKLEGDTLTLIGIGNPWNEVWKRAK